MVTGDNNDMLARLKAALPSRWFGSDMVIAGAVLSGFAASLAWLYSLYLYVQQQTRLATATGVWLDLAASDFFGTGLPRLTNELDPQYRARIRAAIFVEHGTRNAIYFTLMRLTGRAPLIFEPARPADTGALVASGQTAVYGLALNAAGGLGSLQMPYQALVTAYYPLSAGIPLVAGLGVSMGGLNTPSRSCLADQSSQQLNASLTAIFQAVDSVKPIGTIVWVAPSN